MRPTLLAALLASLTASVAHATENPGTTAAPILEIPLSARAQGMAGAFTGVADDITTLEFNPAGLSLLQSKEAYALYMKGLVDQNIEYLALGSPLRWRGISGNGYSSVGGSLIFSQNGSINVNTTNPDGSLASSQTLNAGSDFVGTLGYSERVAETSIDLGPDHSLDINHFVGASGKFIHSTLATSYSASAWATDIGYLARSSDRTWGAGAALLNLGTKMKFISEGDPLPMTMRTGASYRLAHRADADEALLLSVGWDYGVYTRQWQAEGGLEGQFGQVLRARIGYQYHTDIAGLTAGFGINISGLSVDYAWSMNSDLGDTHRLGITFRFGELSPRARERDARRQRSAIESFPPPADMRDLEQQQPENYNPPKKPPIIFPNQDPNAPVWIY